MPEGDTVHLAARRLHAALSGERLTKGELRVPAFAAVDLSGSVVGEVVARGKHLFFRLDDGRSLHTHFKMDGSWHIYRHGDRWRGPNHQVRALLETDERIAVGFRLPVVKLFPTAREADVTQHLGPDVLGEDWDPDEALRRLTADPERAIGDLLLDQSVMAGPGNVYRSEICFLLGVLPDAEVGTLSDPARVVALTKRLMEANCDTGSQVTTGDPRRGRDRWVYGRGGAPCRRCGTLIRRAERPAPHGSRVVFWCPACQTA